jgi:hypothetical protein
LERNKYARSDFSEGFKNLNNKACRELQIRLVLRRSVYKIHWFDVENQSSGIRPRAFRKTLKVACLMSNQNLSVTKITYINVCMSFIKLV